jgi:hypothetical protein
VFRPHARLCARISIRVTPDHGIGIDEKKNLHLHEPRKAPESGHPVPDIVGEKSR